MKTVRFALVVLMALFVMSGQAFALKENVQTDPDGGDEIGVVSDPDGGDEATKASDPDGGDELGIATDPDGGDEVTDDPDGGDEVARPKMSNNEASASGALKTIAN